MFPVIIAYCGKCTMRIIKRLQQKQNTRSMLLEYTSHRLLTFSLLSNFLILYILEK